MQFERPKTAAELRESYHRQKEDTERYQDVCRKCFQPDHRRRM